MGLHEIARPGLAGMVLQEGRPGLPRLTGWQVTPDLFHVLAYGAFVHSVAQFA